MVVKNKMIGPSFFTFGEDVHRYILSAVMQGINETTVKKIWEDTQNSHIKKKMKYHTKIYNKSNSKPKILSQVLTEYNKLVGSKIDGKKLKDTDVTGNPSLSAENYARLKIVTDYFGKSRDYYEWAIQFDKKSKPFVQDFDAFKKPFSNGNHIYRDIAKFNEKFILSARDGLLESGLGVTDRQCIQSCGKKPTNSEGICCYICGEIINIDNGSDPNGSQCEHLVPVCAMAMLCGLSGQDYENSIQNYFKKNGTETTLPDGSKDLIIDIEGINISLEQFNYWRTILIGDNDDSKKAASAVSEAECLPCGGGKKRRGVLYRWAHPGCNIMKSNFPFLALDWDIADDNSEWDTLKSAGYPYINSSKWWDETELKKVLDNLAGKKNGGKDGGGSHSSSWQKYFLETPKKEKSKFKYPDLHLAGRKDIIDPDWIQYRIKNMKDNTLKWASDAILYPGDVSPDIQYFEWNKTPILPASNEWKEIRSALCVCAMNVLDFRVEEKMKDHYLYKIKLSSMSDNEWEKVISASNWRSQDWTNYVGVGGGKPMTRSKYKLKRQDKLRNILLRKSNIHKKSKGTKKKDKKRKVIRKIYRKAYDQPQIVINMPALTSNTYGSVKLKKKTMKIGSKTKVKYSWIHPNKVIDYIAVIIDVLNLDGFPSSLDNKHRNMRVKRSIEMANNSRSMFRTIHYDPVIQNSFKLSIFRNLGKKIDLSDIYDKLKPAGDVEAEPIDFSKVQTNIDPIHDIKSIKKHSSSHKKHSRKKNKLRIKSKRGDRTRELRMANIMNIED